MLQQSASDTKTNTKDVKLEFRSKKGSKGSKGTDDDIDRLIASVDVENITWEKNVALLNRGIQLMFSNRLIQSDALFYWRMNLKNCKTVDGSHDLTSAFAVQYAFTSVLKGVLTMANDQLDECIERLNMCDKIAIDEENWIGKKCVRGLCTLAIGLAQLLQRRYIRGVWNILKSWKWIKALKVEGLNYSGRESQVIRSVSLITVGGFQVLLSLLPPSMVNAATWLSGFEADRVKGLAMIRTAFEEGGIARPYAILIYTIFMVDVKTFILDPQAPEDFAICHKMMEFAQKQYNHPVLFSGAFADLYACQNDLSTALTFLSEETIDRCGDLTAVKMAICYKRGAYNLALLNYNEAAVWFERGMQLQMDAKRRSNIPFMSCYTALCHMAMGEDDTRAQRFFNIIWDCKNNKSKSDWNLLDKFAFDVYDDFRSGKIKNGRKFAKLELTELLIFTIRGSYWMDSDLVGKYLDLVGKEFSKHPDDVFRMSNVKIKLLTHLNKFDAAIKLYNENMKLKSQLSTPVVKYGHFARMDMLLAHIYVLQNKFTEASVILSGFNSRHGNSYYLSSVVSFKVDLLRKYIGDVYEDLYESIDVFPLFKKTIKFHVAADERIEFEWILLRHTVNFSCVFKPLGNDKKVTVMAYKKWDAKDGPCIGSYTASSSGTLKLFFDNPSILYMKDIKYRVLRE